MYAVVTVGGHQHRVTTGDRLLVERCEAQVGSSILLSPVLFAVTDDGVVAPDKLAHVAVEATVLGHPRGRKLYVFKYKAKKRYRKMRGYRSDLTEIRVSRVEVGTESHAHKAPKEHVAPHKEHAAVATEEKA